MAESRNKGKANASSVPRLLVTKAQLDADSAEYFENEEDIFALVTPTNALYRLSNSSPRTWSLVQQGHNATASDPGSGDDIGSGYDVGSVWVNTSSNKVWVCVDSTNSAAVWADTTASGGGGTIGTGADNRVARYNGTTDIQTSGVTLDDSDNITGTNELEVDAGGSPCKWLAGTANPRVGAGVTANEGSLYSRRVAAKGELFTKAGSAATAWNLLTGSPEMYSLQGPAELAAAMGYADAPDWMVKGNESIDATDLGPGGDDLTGAGSPSYQQEETEFNDLLVGFTQGSSTQKLEAAANGDLEPASGSFAFLWVGYLDLIGEFSSHQICGKRESAGSVFGWELFANGISAGNWQFRFAAKDDGPNDLNRNATHTTVKVGPHIFMGTRNVTTKTLALTTRESTSSTTWTTTGDLTSAVKFSIGAGRLDSVGSRVALCAQWFGAGSESLAQKHLQNLERYLKL